MHRTDTVTIALQGGPLNGHRMQLAPRHGWRVLRCFWTKRQITAGRIDEGAMYLSEERYDDQERMTLRFMGTIAERKVN
jgi:hypothetical protein